MLCIDVRSITPNYRCGFESVRLGGVLGVSARWFAEGNLATELIRLIRRASSSGSLVIEAFGESVVVGNIFVWHGSFSF